MILQSIATAVPPNRFTQGECYTALEASPIFSQLNPRSQGLVKRVLSNETSGIHARYFAADSIASIVGRSAQELNEMFELQAPTLAGQALVRALDSAGVNAGELDALFVCTCTGYLCPGVTSHVAEQVGLRSDAFLSDLVGLGCGAAIPTLRSAAGFLALHPGAKVATVAVEVCSAAFYVSDDPGVLVSLCLFGDGAAAALWSDDWRDGSNGGAGKWTIGEFTALHVPEHRESIRFTNAEGKLRNQLAKCVPTIVAEAVAGLFARRKGEPDRILAHSGGRDVIDAIESALATDLVETRAVLTEFGNMSSPSLLFALEKGLASSAADGVSRFWLTAFGAGFSAHACEMWRLP
ncbi:MAG: stilbene synthase [Verrucomicrobia bacterium]|nr:stilbene synthase [Verrucomicrobiota bacterium]